MGFSLLRHHLKRHFRAVEGRVKMKTPFPQKYCQFLLDLKTLTAQILGG
jgi:hypothetical protein